MMEYKSYLADVEFDDDADLFHGEVINIRDVVTFQGRSVEELRGAFKDSIEDYLAFCKQRGEEPDTPFSGKFMLRISPELHREASLAARRTRLSLNAWVAGRLSEGVKGAKGLSSKFGSSKVTMRRKTRPGLHSRRKTKVPSRLRRSPQRTRKTP